MKKRDDAGVLAKMSISEFAPLPESDDQYPLEYMENFSVIKLREDADEVVVGVCDVENVSIQEYLQGFHDKTVRFVEIERSELAVHLGRELSNENPEVGQGAEAEKILLDKLANDAPVINLVNGIFIEGIRANASDIHIESFQDATAVRFRIDGTLRRIRSFERALFPAVASRIKIMANLNIMERRLPQDGRLTVHLDRDTLDMRVSIMPIADGESIVLRLLGKENTPLGLEELGFDEVQVERLRRLSLLPHGLILATGPTGSGKTTTLKAMLRQIDADSSKVITIEDPIEYLLPGIAQVQTNDRIGLTFESILRRILRQDPNVVMVGEIRDAETAELAVRLALTGHLVFSTLHTNDSVSAVTRLRNIGIPSYLTGAVLRAVVAQRLVRRLCPGCRKPTELTTAARALFDSEGVQVGDVFAAVGCEACGSTGYRGRVAIVEMFAADDHIEEMVVAGTHASAIEAYCREQGMRSLLSDGLRKVAAGETSLEEVEHVVMLG